MSLHEAGWLEEGGGGLFVGQGTARGESSFTVCPETVANIRT